VPEDNELQIASVSGVILPSNVTQFQVVPPREVEKVGTVTTGSPTMTINTSSGVTDGLYVFADGVPTGTIVQSGGGTTTLTLSENATETITNSRIIFYQDGASGLLPLQVGSVIRFF
jgi:hypothetical protein